MSVIVKKHPVAGLQRDVFLWLGCMSKCEFFVVRLGRF